jgi:toxin YoeB
VVHPQFFEDLGFWVANDRRTANRVLELIEHIMRDPFHGVGKPEPLKGQLTGSWSRRITHEHRIVYAVYDDRIDFLQCRYHYE